MIDWYYHDPGEGRIGPLSAEELRKRFQDRRIQRDTLVWHHGLREWQPLERMAPDIGLETLQIDTTRPPPLPANTPAPAPIPTHASITTPRSKYSRAPLRDKRTLPTTAIVLIVAGVLGIPALLVLGSMTLSGYRDYAQRATRLGSMDGLANGLKQVAGDYALRTGRCLRNDDPRVVNLRNEIRQRFSADVRFATIDGGCAFEVAINARKPGGGTPLDGRTLRYEGYRDGNEFAWECSGGTLAEEDRPHECRSRGRARIRT
ncbi:GYF domain-containing protein [Lysobacter sp. Root494]|uniref:GYF domain-containing protein n=1 Tax=Lysobacter sp. Root494 TaxID=1736549 RepID=UPI0006F8A82F|nr:GYF domain-containing protein [Lysobacter sp. Root494]KQY54862.1 hypothetical protein ASD14_01420 [Lysobacter sp. Root494]